MKKKSLLVVLLILLLIVISFGGYILYKNSKPTEEPTVEPVPQTEPVDPEVEARQKELRKYKREWNENYKINSDYVGEIWFDSGLIRQSFVQARSSRKADGTPYKFYTENGSLVANVDAYTGNDVYIWTYWKTGEYDYNNHGGSVFLDYRNNLEDQNLIVYGHHFSVWNDETRQKAFTPLEKFLEEENYEPNKDITMVLENEVRHYRIVAVYQYDAYSQEHEDTLQYWRPYYNVDDYTGEIDENYYANYIKKLDEVKLYETGETLTTEDKTLTLQTCISGYTGRLFEVVVAKLVDVETY